MKAWKHWIKDERSETLQKRLKIGDTIEKMKDLKHYRKDKRLETL